MLRALRVLRGEFRYLSPIAELHYLGRLLVPGAVSFLPFVVVASLMADALREGPVATKM